MDPWAGGQSATAAPITGLATLAQIQVLVSAAGEEYRLRKIASDIFVRINHMLLQVYNRRVVFTEWNYELDPPREVQPGHLADRSLQAVEQSELVIAIVGRTVGEIARQEVLRHYQLKGLGLTPRTLWLFAHKPRPRRSSEYAPLASLGAEVQETFNEGIAYQEVGNDLEFQAGLMIRLVPYALSRAGLVTIPFQSFSQ